MAFVGIDQTIHYNLGGANVRFDQAQGGDWTHPEGDGINHYDGVGGQSTHNYPGVNFGGNVETLLQAGTLLTGYTVRTAMPDLPPVSGAGSWVGPPPEVVAAVVAEEGRPDDAAEALQRVVQRDASVLWPIDREWQLLARLGEVRSLGTAGSVPLLVVGIDAASVETPALLHRIASMSELVQMIVLSDDERLGRWCDGLDVDARLLRWSP